MTVRITSRYSQKGKQLDKVVSHTFSFDSIDEIVNFTGICSTLPNSEWFLPLFRFVKQMQCNFLFLKVLKTTTSNQVMTTVAKT